MASSRTALLVVDMQRVFEPMTTATALPNIKLLISHFQASSAPIIFTQHGHSKEELTTVPSPSQLVRKWGPDGSIAYGSQDWEFQDYFQETMDDAKNRKETWPRVVHKNTYDAFINTNLAQILEEEKVERTVVCGVMTDCCWGAFGAYCPLQYSDTTARSAFNRGYETWLVSDACGTANETQHKAGLRGFGYAFGHVLTTQQALKLMK